MARGRRSVSSPPTSAPISIGNCEVVVEAKNFTSESSRDGLQISLSKTAKIRISVLCGSGDSVNEHDGDFGGRGPEKCGNFYFVLANPKDLDGQTKSLLQVVYVESKCQQLFVDWDAGLLAILYSDRNVCSCCNAHNCELLYGMPVEVLTLYMKELPAMNYAANTGKESMFLERCVTNGKYCTLLLKSNDDKPGEVIAALTYQIIPADTQYAEVPLAAVNSIFQRKGLGRLLYLELRKRLQSVGIRTLFCWGDKESEGFWLKQGFTVIGEVDKKGRARKLPIKADVRRALCFPGGSTLMVSHLQSDSSCKAVDLSTLCLQLKLPELNFEKQEPRQIVGSHEPSKEDNRVADSGYSDSTKLETKFFSADGCHEIGLSPVTLNCNVASASGIREGGNEYDDGDCSCSVQGTKKRMWEASRTSLKSKKVKGTYSNDCQLASCCPVWTSDRRIVNCPDRNCCLTGNEISPDALLTNSGSNSMVMLMNMADNDKKSRLTKIIEDLGGIVASDGSVSTHVVTGKVRVTLNFCTALCSGAWVISSGWLKESFKSGRFVDEVPFILIDEDYRKRYRIDLKSAVVRAKASPSALLKGLDIWLATHVHPPANTLSAIVKSAGGNVIRTQNEINDVSKTIFVACEEDMDEALSAVKLGIWTFSSDWLMSCIMKQELDLGAPQFAESL
ncbi:hypothetical protein Sango_0849600 [Sesamum angolense]|uniref:N-acetyltransferase n=1 Tax=Sesamum angolense TaxID=2727404 RepID=A0AAE2C130_9LAMI|nr:hypothetical protein Sango_0849600 [Sesamum angolense]